ncbi:hypothetical protein WA026_003017, partial [Henosepilachna vigintioctopunctata]
NCKRLCFSTGAPSSPMAAAATMGALVTPPVAAAAGDRVGRTTLMPPLGQRSIPAAAALWNRGPRPRNNVAVGGYIRAEGWSPIRMRLL